LGQALQDREIALVKSKGLRRENLDQSDDLTLVMGGCGHDGADAEAPAPSVRVEPSVSRRGTLR